MPGIQESPQEAEPAHSHLAELESLIQRKADLEHEIAEEIRSVQERVHDLTSDMLQMVQKKIDEQLQTTAPLIEESSMLVKEIDDLENTKNQMKELLGGFSYQMSSIFLPENCSQKENGDKLESTASTCHEFHLPKKEVMSKSPETWSTESVMSEGQGSGVTGAYENSNASKF